MTRNQAQNNAVHVKWTGSFHVSPKCLPATGKHYWIGCRGREDVELFVKPTFVKE